MRSLQSETSFSRLPILAVAATLAWIPLQAAEPKAERVVLETRGYIVPASQVTVGPKVAGQVAEWLIEEGSRVKTGDVLARLDPEEYAVALDLARAKLKLAEAELLNAGKMERAVAEAKAGVARAEVAVAQYHLNCTTIRAPIDGIVLAKRAEVGSRIDPKSPSLPASLCDMADVRTIEVEAWIQERDLAKVAKDQACMVYVDALPNATYQGRVARMQPAADRARGALAVRVRLEMPAGSEWLRPELSATVRFMAKE